MTSPATASGQDECPCGSVRRFGECCEPLLDGVPGLTAEAVMRSRYTAYVLGHRDHLLRTWHPRTRPDDVDPPAVTWTGLTVVETRDGAAADDTGVVGFEARFTTGDHAEVLRETSWFEKRARRWFYVGPLEDD